MARLASGIEREMPRLDADPARSGLALGIPAEQLRYEFFGPFESLGR